MRAPPAARAARVAGLPAPAAAAAAQDKASPVADGPAHSGGHRSFSEGPPDLSASSGLSRRQREQRSGRH
eukprot:5001308-Prorocentrum_lima.AAC.1